MNQSALILIRGLPGSGKSTLAELIMKGDPEVGNPHYAHFENDMYHIGRNGVYNFVPEHVPLAAQWCRNSVREWMEKHEETVTIVSNTFTRNWEMKPYVDLAKEFGAKLTVITCEGNYGNVHGVPEEVIERMRARWEPFNL